ncbi:MAG: PEP-CTERM sorting domain-containing protein [Acidobacteriia bacterium]|nr:PEP-CTERM sorting domain-containing protein [Terriglobia bacterium]
MVFVPLATAGDIDFLFAGGNWAWAGGVGSTLNAASTTVQVNGNFLFLPLSLTSGGAIGGDGSVGNPFTWGTGGNITIDGCGGPCFSGIFLTAQLGFNGGGGMTFVGNFISGSVDPLLLAFLGLPVSQTGFSGLIHMDINPAPVSFAAGGQGVVGSGDIHLEPVPEPGTLAMFGSGLIGMAGVLRRKFNL